MESVSIAHLKKKIRSKSNKKEKIAQQLFFSQHNNKKQHHAADDNKRLFLIKMHDFKKQIKILKFALIKLLSSYGLCYCS